MANMANTEGGGNFSLVGMFVPKWGGGRIKSLFFCAEVRVKELKFVNILRACELQFGPNLG